MPKYEFTAVDMQRRKVRAVAEARDERDFHAKMRSQSLVPIKFKELKEEHIRYRMKANGVAEFSRELANMLGSGVTVLRALEIMRDRDIPENLKLLYTRMHRDVQSGMTLSEAMRNQPNAFPELIVNMYASGEASGQLDRVAAKMAQHYTSEHRINGKVRSAMMYPLILAILMAGVVMLLFTVVLPPLFEVIQGPDMPFLTGLILGISIFMQKNWFLVIFFVLVFILVIQLVLKIDSVAYQIDHLKLTMRGIGRLFKIIYTARFSRTLATLYSSGISMIRALEISSTIIGNRFIARQFDEVIKDVRNGESLSRAIGKVEGFDNKLPNSIVVGEETGQLDGLLNSIADGFDYEAEMATDKLVQMLTPIMLVIMAVVVGSILLAVMLGVMTMYQSISQM